MIDLEKQITGAMLVVQARTLLVQLPEDEDHSMYYKALSDMIVRCLSDLQNQDEEDRGWVDQLLTPFKRKHEARSDVRLD